MHELSIAYNIIEIVTAKASENNAVKVNEIEIDIGEVSGVVSEALETALEFAKKDSVAKNAKVIINQVKSEAICNNCKTVFTPSDIISSCPNCNSFEINIVKGTEMRVKSINIE